MTTQEAIAAALSLPLDMATQKQVLHACMAAYAKHHIGKDDIGWGELGDILCDAICEALGDDGYQAWLLSIALTS
ncbi:MAG: hypothetical protein Q8R07_05795 [Candidatus Uhrbacteria bacterium]|nr:hypothetical protein [Candidatus Uhrbacteria bacterium]